jgi:hypothetical protein
MTCRGNQYAAREEDMDWYIDDETIRALGGERLTITFDAAELVPGTYMYLDADDDEVIVRGAVLEPEAEPEAKVEIDDAESGVPPALLNFGDTDFDDSDDDEDTDPDGRTFIGPLMAPREPGPATTPIPARATTMKGPPVQLRPPVPEPDQILNEIDDDLGGSTEMGSPITPRRPAPKRR